MKNEKKNNWSEGFLCGQRKLCQAILEMKFGSVADYQWLLSHLKEVAENREVLENTEIGFVDMNKK